MIAPAERATEIGELGIDARGLERSSGLAEQERNRLGGLVGRLNPEHEFEAFVFPVVPAEPAFRFQKHRVDRLGLEDTVEHQQGRIFRIEFGADLLAINRGLAIGRQGLLGEGRPDRKGSVLDAPW